MKISYNWLKDYVSLEIAPSGVAEALTAIGLETGATEEVETIKGGLEGLVTGEVLTCEKHPDADHLCLTRVDVGEETPLQIVCGAPNVATGQKVVVAPVGTTLYDGDRAMKIKRTRIRGVESQGMICAEDEIGVGTDHSGIIVLPTGTPTGIPAREVYAVEKDYVLEVDVTPNRVDAASHFGVARDLAAYLREHDRPTMLTRPPVEDFYVDDPDGRAVAVEVAETRACLRYSGVTIRNVRVGESPAWLRSRLMRIGLRPINNVVDVTNYVLHELGQPLHAFDAGKIAGERVVVRTLPEGTPFRTLDGVERRLTDEDLMICDAEGHPMCIGGVFGGLDSGVTEATQNVFLESACFHPTWIRRTARRFDLHTDASFRFERGLDPNQTADVLKRAVGLLRSVAGGQVTGAIRDVYPVPMNPFRVELTYRKVYSLVGMWIPVETIKSILKSLEMEITAETQEGLTVRVPVYRYDVRREVDVIEELLRIYGYNRVKRKTHFYVSLNARTETDESYRLEHLVAEQLCGAGFQEILNNSLTRAAYYEGLRVFPTAECVPLENPLSADLNVMRQTLLFGGLQSVAFNVKRQNRRAYFFEFGNCYMRREPKESEEAHPPLACYREEYRLGLWISGNRVEHHWAHPDERTSVYELKAHVEHLLRRLGVKNTQWECFSDEVFRAGIEIKSSAGCHLGRLGVIDDEIVRRLDVGQEVFYAELAWKALLDEGGRHRTTVQETPRFPEVRRDLALLVDRETQFEEIRQTALSCEQRLLKEVTLFDVYEGRRLPPGKKSYAVSFFLQDPKGTLKEKQIEGIMSRIERKLNERIGAVRR
jgi:phenylalanyl-tRNA synthetase beta chain